MDSKKKPIVFILGIGAIAIIALVACIFHFRNDTMQIYQQLELAQIEASKHEAVRMQYLFGKNGSCLGG